jgi:hypothetical protein
MTEIAYKRLANAIVTQAVHDYRTSLKKKKVIENKLVKCNKNKVGLEESLLDIDIEISKLEQFFRSEWCDFLCGDVIKGEKIIKEIRKQVCKNGI